MTIGERIKAARNNAMLTQAQLAEKCGLAAITIHQYESGKRQPRLEQLAKIARAMGLYVSDLVGEDWRSVDVNGAWDDTKDPLKARLETAYACLNDEGQKKAVAWLEDLTEIPRYRKHATNPNEQKPQD